MELKQRWFLPGYQIVGGMVVSSSNMLPLEWAYRLSPAVGMKLKYKQFRFKVNQPHLGSAGTSPRILPCPGGVINSGNPSLD